MAARHAMQCKQTDSSHATLVIKEVISLFQLFQQIYSKLPRDYVVKNRPKRNINVFIKLMATGKTQEIESCHDSYLVYCGLQAACQQGSQPARQVTQLLLSSVTQILSQIIISCHVQTTKSHGPENLGHGIEIIFYLTLFNCWEMFLQTYAVANRFPLDPCGYTSISN